MFYVQIFFLICCTLDEISISFMGRLLERVKFIGCATERNRILNAFEAAMRARA